MNKDKALHETAAIRTRSGLASRHLVDKLSPAHLIVRQRGTRVKPGLNVGRGKDDTLFAKVTGKIKFLDKGTMGKFVMVEPVEVT